MTNAPEKVFVSYRTFVPSYFVTIRNSKFSLVLFILFLLVCLFLGLVWLKRSKGKSHKYYFVVQTDGHTMMTWGGRHLCLVILKSLNTWQSYSQDKNVYLQTAKCDLDLIGYDICLWHDTSSWCGRHLCKVILKSINACKLGHTDGWCDFNMLPFRGIKSLQCYIFNNLFYCIKGTCFSDYLFFKRISPKIIPKSLCCSFMDFLKKKIWGNPSETQHGCSVDICSEVLWGPIFWQQILMAVLQSKTTVYVNVISLNTRICKCHVVIYGKCYHDVEMVHD